MFLTYNGFPWWLSGKESICNAGNIGDMGSTLGLGKSPGEGYGSQIQYSCGDSHGQKSRWATVHGVAKSQMQLSDFHTHTHTHTHTFSS